MGEPFTTPTDELENLARSRFSDLSEAELQVLHSAPRGEVAYCGPSKSDADLANDPQRGDRWSSERSLRAELVRWLCVNGEAAKTVDPRGIHVYAGRVIGKLDLSDVTVNFPLRFERCLFSTDTNLQYIKIPALSLAGSRARSINAEGANVAGGVSLGDGFLAEGEVRLIDAQIGTELHCTGGAFKNRGGKALSADGLKVGGGLFLRKGFSAEGEVRLRDAQIGGSLACSGGQFKNPGGPALSAERVRVGGSVFLRERCFAEGVVGLAEAQIGGDLDCDRSTFKNSGAAALDADGIKVGGSVFLRQGSVEGEVRLPGAQIGTDLDCKGCKVKNLGNAALNAERIKVGGSVFLSDGFSAEGEVSTSGAQIERNLECQGGALKNSGGFALIAENASVGGIVFLGNGFSAEGIVSLFGAQIGGSLVCNGGMFSWLLLNTAVIKGIFSWVAVRSAPNTGLDLANASAGAIADDEPSWPGKGYFSLDGFSYARISGGPTDAKKRLEWLDRQKDFRPQPYRQLAKVLGESGDDEGAKQVLFEMERRRWAGNRRRLIRAWGRVFGNAVGYGVYPENAIWYLGGLTAVGWILFRRAYRAGAMAPTDKEAHAEFQTRGHPPAYYPPFNPLIYSLENCVPLVKLGQDDHWQPDPNPQGRPASVAPEASFRQRVANLVLARMSARAVSPTVLRWCRWVMIGLGWLLATFFVAGVAAIVKGSP